MAIFCQMMARSNSSSRYPELVSGSIALQTRNIWCSALPWVLKQVQDDVEDVSQPSLNIAGFLHEMIDNGLKCVFFTFPSKKRVIIAFDLLMRAGAACDDLI